MTCPHPLLTELVLGAISPGASAEEAATHAAGCEPCGLELTRLRESLALLATALPTRRAPGLSRLLASVGHVERFAGHSAALADLFDIGANDARHLLQDFSVEDGWKLAPLPGITWKRVPLGPGLRGATGTLARLEPGAVFPLHEHVGEERVLVIQGALLDGDAVITEGRSGVGLAGSLHSVAASSTSACACYCALVNLGGIVFR